MAAPCLFVSGLRQCGHHLGCASLLWPEAVWASAGFSCGCCAHVPPAAAWRPTEPVLHLPAFLQGELPDEATIKRLLRKGTIEGKFVPMCCGTAFKNKGVQPLLDAVVDYLPAPTDLADVKGSAVDDPEKVRAMFGWLVGIDWAGFSTACPPPPTWPTSRALLWMTRRR